MSPQQEWRMRNPLKYKAHNAVQNAVKYGRLPKISQCKCVLCGSQAHERHHTDYRFPLLVKPVCKSCHTKVHLERGTPK